MALHGETVLASQLAGSCVAAAAAAADTDPNSSRSTVAAVVLQHDLDLVHCHLATAVVAARKAEAHTGQLPAPVAFEDHPAVHDTDQVEAVYALARHLAVEKAAEQRTVGPLAAAANSHGLQAGVDRGVRSSCQAELVVQMVLVVG
jgi:hypothetical protein